MYIPKAFQIDDADVTTAFMRANSFATLVSTGPNGLEASHLPFIVRQSDEGAISLHAHLARANPQWQHFDGSTQALVIFQGPHAYVSPSLPDAPQRADVELPGRPRIRHAFGRR